MNSFKILLGFFLNLTSAIIAIWVKFFGDSYASAGLTQFLILVGIITAVIGIYLGIRAQLVPIGFPKILLGVSIMSISIAIAKWDGPSGEYASAGQPTSVIVVGILIGLIGAFISIKGLMEKDPPAE